MENPSTHTPFLIAMAGLPGTGKSAIASLLEKHLHALVLSKDVIRARVFSGKAVDFSRAQDDLCMEIMFVIAEFVLRANANQTVIIEGRTFSRVCQVERLLTWAVSLKVKPAIIKCVCSDAVARQRLDDDRRRGAHPAGNRTYELYLALKGKADPLIVDRLVIDTGREPPEQSAERCLAYLKELDDRSPRVPGT